MNDPCYEKYLERQSIDDLNSIKKALDSQIYPERYSLVLAEIAKRDKLPGTGRAQPIPDATPVQKPKIIIGVVSALFGVAAGIYVNIMLRVAANGVWRLVTLLIGFFTCLVVCLVVNVVGRGLYITLVYLWRRRWRASRGLSGRESL